VCSREKSRVKARAVLWSRRRHLPRHKASHSPPRKHLPKRKSQMWRKSTTKNNCAPTDQHTVLPLCKLPLRLRLIAMPSNRSERVRCSRSMASPSNSTSGLLLPSQHLQSNAWRSQSACGCIAVATTAEFSTAQRRCA
jgi:hypothetical protein